MTRSCPSRACHRPLRWCLAILVLGALPAWGWEPPPPDLDFVVHAAHPVQAARNDGASATVALRQCLTAVAERHRCLRARLGGRG